MCTTQTNLIVHKKDCMHGLVVGDVKYTIVSGYITSLVRDKHHFAAHHAFAKVGLAGGQAVRGHCDQFNVER